MRFRHSPVPITIALLCTIAFRAEPDVTGRVLDNSGKPVPNATITYTNLSNRLTWTFAGSDGRFTLPDPTKAAWNAPDTTKWTALREPTISLTPNSLNLLYARGLVYFNAPGNRRVTLTVYTAAGKTVSEKKMTPLTHGRYALEALSLFKARPASGLYILRISSGNESSLLCIPHMGTRITSVAESGRHDVALPKMVRNFAAAGVDGVRVGRTFLIPVTKTIAGYSDNIGDITLTRFDPEKRIDSVIAAAADSPYVYLNQCMMHNEWDTPEASAQKSAGAHLMAGHVKPTVTGDARLAASYAAYMNGYRTAYRNSLHKIPFLTAYDAVHGVNMCDNTTIFPHNVAFGAMRDIPLTQVAYRVTAIEMAGTGCPWTFAPCIAVARNIGWGRTYESYGETPELVSKMAKAAVLGLQMYDLSHPLAVAACAKHFAGDGGTAKGTSSMAEALYDRGNTNTGTDQVLRAIHLAPYKSALEGEVASIMASFSLWNGVLMHANKTLLTDWLKTQMSFQGFICGDYDAHTVVPGGEEACMMAGLDMAMQAGTPPQKLNNLYQTMYAAGGDKKTRVLDAVRRILRIKFALGLFDRAPQADPAVTALAGNQLHRDVARACVRESMVLLKNQNSVLPLKKTAKIHLIGSHADNLGYQCGGWTLGWAEQNLTNDAFIGATTIKAGFEKLVQSPGKVTWAKDAYTIPADADVVVIVFGEKVHAEWFGDSDNLGPEDWKILPGDANPVQILSEAKKAGKPIIGIVVCARPLIVSSYIADLSGLVCIWLPGTEGGGVAEVMYGDYDFKGTLPHSWPNAFAQEPCNTTATEYGGDKGDLKGAAGTVQWQYGYGLSYKNGTLKAAY
jgi:beta-glucosidase